MSNGIHAELSPNEGRKVRLLNIMALVGLACFLFLLVINLAKGSPVVFLVTNLSGQLILVLTLVFNSLRYYRIARWFCLTFFLVFFNGVSFLLGPESGIEYLNILLCVCPLVFFDSLREIIVMSSLSLIGFLISKLGYASFEPVFQNPNIKVIYVINMIILFVSSFLLLFFYRNEILRYSLIVENQNLQLGAKNKEITDSMNYARRIQNALMRFDKGIESALPESFIFFRPKEAVGGDFFWFHREGDKIWAACVDCTGHGIPGAFMTMIGITLLNDIVVERSICEPALVLDELNSGITRLFKQREEEQRVMRDGMELTFLELDLNTRVLRYACANTVFAFVRGTSFTILKGDNQPIGWHIGPVKPFTTNKIQLERGDQLFLFSDGFADQFGGELGKKFLFSRLRKLLMEVSKQPATVQKEQIIERFEAWKAELDQVDDVTLIGAKIP